MKPLRRIVLLLIAVLTALTARSGDVVDVVQYAPIALPWAIKAAGQPTRSKWGTMGVAQASATLMMCGITYTAKHWIESDRPDHTDRRSFPSGHAAWSYLGATFVSAELGWRSPWYSLGAYSVASAVGMQRVLSRRHWGADVAAGEAIGIGTGVLGYVISDAIFGVGGHDVHYSVAPAEAATRSYLEVKNALQISVGERRIWRRPAYAVGLDGGLAIADTPWLLTAEALLTALDIEHGSPVTVAREASLVVMPGWSRAASGRVLLTGRLGVGITANLGSNGPVKGRGASALGALSAGASLTLTDRWSCAAEAAWRVSRYSYSVPNIGREEGTDLRLMLALSSRINF